MPWRLGARGKSRPQTHKAANPTLKLAWVPAWLPASSPEPHTTVPQPQLEHRLGMLPSETATESKSQTLFILASIPASLKTDPLQSTKLLGKYFPFKMTLYGEGETFRKQRLLILAGMASAAPSQVSALREAAADGKHNQLLAFPTPKAACCFLADLQASFFTSSGMRFSVSFSLALKRLRSYHKRL